MLVDEGMPILLSPSPAQWGDCEVLADDVISVDVSGLMPPGEKPPNVPKVL